MIGFAFSKKLFSWPCFLREAFKSQGVLRVLLDFFSSSPNFFFKSQRVLRVLLDFFSSSPNFFFKSQLLLFALLLWPLSLSAVTIRFPDEELSSESVLPLMEPPRMVLNRNVPLKFRIETGLLAGFRLDEPFYQRLFGSGLLGFHIGEEHAFYLKGTYFLPGLSGDGQNFAKGDPKKNGTWNNKKYDPSRIPYPQMAVFLNYQYSPFYGKISLTKRWVMNLSIYGFAGPGLLIFDGNARTVIGNFGIGQKLYFNKWFGLRGDLNFYGYYGPAPARIDLKENMVKVLNQDISAEQKTLIFNTVAHLGLIFLI